MKLIEGKKYTEIDGHVFTFDNCLECMYSRHEIGCDYISDERQHCTYPVKPADLDRFYREEEDWNKVTCHLFDGFPEDCPLRDMRTTV